MPETVAQKNRAVRQEELRAYLSERGRVSYVLDNIEKIEELDVSDSDFTKSLGKLKTATELRLRLLSKYLSDAKEDTTDSVEIPPIVINLAGNEPN